MDREAHARQTIAQAKVHGNRPISCYVTSRCAVEIGDQVEWILRDLLTGGVSKRQDATNRVDLW